MTITWSGGADINQQFTASPVNLTVLTIPAGAITAVGGTLLVSLALTVVPGTAITDPFSNPGFVDITIVDSLSQPVAFGSGAFQAASSGFTRIGGATQMVARTTANMLGGAAVVIQFLFTDSSESVLGTIVAAFDNTDTAPSGGINQIYGPEAIEEFGPDSSGSNQSILPFNWRFGQLSKLLLAAAGVIHAEAGAQINLAGDPNWSNVIQRALSFTPCATDSTGAFLGTGATAGTFSVFGGTLPAGASTAQIQYGVSLTSNTFGAQPVFHVQAQLLDSGGVALLSSPSITLNTGPLLGSEFANGVWDLTIPAGAHHFVIKVTASFGVPSGDSVSFGNLFQSAIWCNGETQDDYAVAIGHWTGSFRTSPLGGVIPYSFSWPTPGDSLMNGEFGVWDFDVPAPAPGGNWVAVIGD